MPQFTLYRNGNQQTRADYPYLLDVQAELLQSLKTRLVIPASRYEKGAVIDRLNPVFDHENKKYRLLTQQMAGIPIVNLAEAVADLTPMRDEIIAAIDILITGI